MRISRPGSLGLATTLAALALGGAAAIPAHAADATLTVEAPAAVAVDPSSTSPNQHGANYTYVPVNLTFSNHPEPATGRVTIDLTPLQGVASVFPLGGCTIVGQVLTCDQQTMYNGQSNIGFDLYAPEGGGQAGNSAVLHTTAVFDGQTAGADTKVTLGGSNLTMPSIDTNSSLHVGDTWTPDLTVVNKGQLPASQLYFTFIGGMDLTFLPQFSNCEYGTGADGDAVICTVHSEVAAGETVHLDPIGFKVDPTAYHAYEDVSVSATAPSKDGWLAGFTWAQGPAAGPALTVGKPITQGAPNDVADFNRGNATTLNAVVPNTADFAVKGSWTPSSGTRGELTVDFANNGPGSIFWRSGSYPARVRVTVPKAVRVVGGSPACSRDVEDSNQVVTVWDCVTFPYIKSGDQYRFNLTLDLDQSAGLSAQITLPSIGEDGQDSGMPWDPNPANNTITVPLGAI
ncbi:hypothetical protein ACIQF6_06530 [Kitasatospora sp. NPDC092948]|uniref:hypothetical protein n=1 Tax=Kitasatospora sp. NPDC092948 TaxID=3364088 RepID=UPI00380BD2F4